MLVTRLVSVVMLSRAWSPSGGRRTSSRQQVRRSHTQHIPCCCNSCPIARVMHLCVFPFCKRLLQGQLQVATSPPADV
jgi:hypothetical protein